MTIRSDMTVQQLIDELDSLWTRNASTAHDIARTKARRDGHKYSVVDRESVKAALKELISD
jgi:hypothetical protein